MWQGDGFELVEDLLSRFYFNSSNRTLFMAINVYVEMLWAVDSTSLEVCIEETYLSSIKWHLSFFDISIGSRLRSLELLFAKRFRVCGCCSAELIKTKSVCCGQRRITVLLISARGALKALHKKQPRS